MNNISLKKRICSRAGGAVFLLASSPVLLAGPVVEPPPGANTMPTWAEQEAQNNEMQVFIPSTENLRKDEPFVFGPLTIRPHVDYDITYAEGLLLNTNGAVGTNTIQHANTHSSFIQTITPGISIDIGNHWTLDYTPSLVYYSDHDFANQLNHSASLSGATEYGDWVLGLTQTFALDSSLQSQTASQTETTTFNTSMTGTYTINERMSADLALNQELNYVKGFVDSKTWSTMDWLNYSFWKRLDVGVGVGGGYVVLSRDPAAPPGNPEPGNQYFEDLQGRVNWRAVDKLSFSVNAGFENRHFDASGGTPATSSLTPIYGASIQYLPFKHTQLSLSANQTVNSSDYSVQSQSEVNTAVTLALNQRLFEKFYLDVSAGYNRVDYRQAVAGFGGSSRTDDNYSFSLRLTRQVLKRGSVAVHYQYTDYQSTAPGFTYDSNQVGLELNYTY